MVKYEIGGRSVDITKDDGKIKVVFHPIAKGAKHPDATVFSVKLSKTDLETFKDSPTCCVTGGRISSAPVCVG